MNINDYMRKINYQPNNAHTPDYIIKGFEEEKQKEAIKKQQAENIQKMQADVENQKASQNSMAKALSDMVALQQQYNNLIENQCDYLKSENIKKDKQIKKQRIWNIIAYSITTFIALASAIASFIAIFK